MFESVDSASLESVGSDSLESADKASGGSKKLLARSILFLAVSSKLGSVGKTEGLARFAWLYQ